MKGFISIDDDNGPRGWVRSAAVQEVRAFLPPMIGEGPDYWEVRLYMSSEPDDYRIAASGLDGAGSRAVCNAIAAKLSADWEAEHG